MQKKKRKKKVGGKTEEKTTREPADRRHWALTRTQATAECCTNNVSGDTRPSRIDTGTGSEPTSIVSTCVSVSVCL